MPAHVQDANANSSSAASVVVTLGSDVTAGNTVIATIPLPGGASVESILDSLGDPWIQVGFANSPGGNAEIWMSRGIFAGSLSASVTFSGPVTAGVNIAEFSGLWYVAPLDSWSQQFGTAASDTSPNISSSQVPRTTSDLSVIVASSNAPITGTPSGYTALTESGSTGYAAAYTVMSASVLVQPAWTASAGIWSAVSALFRPGPSGLNPRLQFPETLVQICVVQNFYTEPVDGNAQWTDISSYVRNMTIGPIGRQHELDRVQASTAEITVNNRDGTFNPWNGLSPININSNILTPMTPVRACAAWNGATSPVYFGYLQSVTPNIADVLNVDATISCVDILQMLSLKYLSNDNYAQLVESETGLEAYYRLGDAVSSFSVIDTFGGNTGSLVDSGESPAYGAIGPFLYDTSTALDLTNGTNLPGGGFCTNDRSQQPPVDYDPLSAANPGWSFECWFQWVGTAIPAPATPGNATVNLVGTVVGNVNRQRRAATPIPAVTVSSTASSVAAVPNGTVAHFSANGDYEFQLGYNAIAFASGGLPHVTQVIPFSNSFSVVSASVGNSGIFTFPINPLDGNWHHLVVATQSQTVSPLLATISVPGDSTAIALTPDGRLAYVVNEFTSDSVSIIDTTTNTVVGSPISVSSNPTGIAITPDGKHAYVSMGALATGASVTVISTASNTVTNVIPLASGLIAYDVAITPDGTRAYVGMGTATSGSVAVINTSTNLVVGPYIPVGDSPQSLAVTPNGLFTYVANFGSNSVSVIDTTAASVVGSPISTGGAGHNPSAIAITPSGSFAYVATQVSNSVVVINTGTNTVVGSGISVAGTPTSVIVSPNGNFVYVGCSSGATIDLISVASNTVIGTISVAVDGLAISTDGTLLYATDSGTHVRVIGQTPAAINVYLDSVLANNVQELDVISTFANPIDITVGCPPAGAPGFDPLLGTNFSQGLPAVISDVALYAVQLTQTQVTSHYQVGKWFQFQEFGAADGDGAAGRFNKVLDVAGLDPNVILKVPYPWMTALYAETNVINTTSALNYMQTTTQSEPGLIYQGPDGFIYAWNREYQYINPTSINSQGIFADSDSTTLHYDGPSLQIAQDDEDVWNDIQVQSGASGDLNSNFFAGEVGNPSGAVLQEWGPVQSSDAAFSATLYGERTLQGLTSLQMANDSDALAIAQNYGAWYNFPVIRVTQMTLNSQGSGGSMIPQMLQRRLYDRITVQYQGQTPSEPFGQDALIEQITHTIQMDNGPTWVTSLALSPYEILLPAFYLDSSLTDGTDVLVL